MPWVLWLCVAALLRLLWVLPPRITRLHCRRLRRRSSGTIPAATVRTMVVLGSGGHTGEMIRLLPALLPATPSDPAAGRRYTPLVFVAAASDTLSPRRVQATHPDATYTTLPRSRAVGQSWLTTVPTTLYACAVAVAVVLWHRPGLLLVNGPGTCVPVCGAAVLWNFLGVTDTRIVFVESVCRVQGLSLTGTLLFPLAHRVVVQWPQLHRPPLTDYVGLLF